MINHDIIMLGLGVGTFNLFGFLVLFLLGGGNKLDLVVCLITIVCMLALVL